jgi:hypothetical protein
MSTIYIKVAIWQNILCADQNSNWPNFNCTTAAVV